MDRREADEDDDHVSPTDLRLRAHRCRWLAAQVSDVLAIERLQQYAATLEWCADQIELAATHQAS
jgi:hypothetical protein